ncbi:MAG: SAM-dependent methyltransferase [Mariprofundaceae bacterium]
MNSFKKELEAVLIRKIESENGWLAFDKFMKIALYEPTLGYYESAHVFGQKGDYITANALGPWLSLGMIDLIHRGWQQMGEPSQWSLVEQGGGNGQLLADVAEGLHDRNVVAPKLIAIEASHAMRKRQAKHYKDRRLEVQHFAEVSACGVQEHCIVICNELLDAFPVRTFQYQQGLLYERGVIQHEDCFQWQTNQYELSNDDTPAILKSLMEAWPEGYKSEWNPALTTWQQGIANLIGKGYLFCVDYGYHAGEYYRPQRHEGTLLAHHNHQASDDVLTTPGERDITAHVDFSALKQAGETVGLKTNCFMSQGGWLAQSPSVQQHLQKLAIRTDADAIAEIAQAKRLLLPNGMGELFKLFVQGKGSDIKVPPYLTSFNRVDYL